MTLPDSVDFRLDEIEREPLVDAAEERLALAQDYRVNNQPELIDQILVQKAGDESCPADDIHALSWLALEGSELRDVPDDLRGGPRDALEGCGQNNVGCLSSQPCVRDFTLRGDSVLERRDSLRIGVYRFPVLPVVWVHASSEDERVDVRDQLDRVGPRIDPVLLSLWSLGEAIQRDLKCSDHRSGCVECHDCSFANRRVSRCGTGRSFRCRCDLVLVGHEIDLAPGIGTVGVTSVAGFRVCPAEAICEVSAKADGLADHGGGACTRGG